MEAEPEEQFRPAANVLNGLKVALGIAVLAHIAGTVAVGWGESDRWDLARQIDLPVWMALWLVPFVFLFALFTEYEKVFEVVNKLAY